MKKNIVIGTRKSKLALWQAEFIAGQIRQQHPGIDVTLQKIVTTGDKILDVPLAKVGGKGLFTKELENAMLAGEIDIAVHSLKDMPAELPEGLTLAAVTGRAHPGDALISPRYRTIDNLPPGAKVGTSSLRRRAQLLKYRPDLEIVDLRGNLDTRLKKLEMGLDAIVLAVSGLMRLNWEHHITQILPQEICLPAVGQGALAIEARGGDQEVLDVIGFLNDKDTRAAVTAERAFLREIEGGCQVPVGVYARLKEEQLELEAVILSADGSTSVYDKIGGRPQQADWLGQELARRMLAAGGRKILAELMP